MKKWMNVSLCGVLLASAVGYGFYAFDQAQKTMDKIQKANEDKSKAEEKTQQAEKDLETVDSTENAMQTVYDDVTKKGKEIAEFQNRYADADTMEDQIAVADEMISYFEKSDGAVCWYDYDKSKVNGAWQMMPVYNIDANQIPVIWQMIQEGTNNVLAVSYGTYNAQTGLFSVPSYAWTSSGSEFMEDGGWGDDAKDSLNNTNDYVSQIQDSADSESESGDGISAEDKSDIMDARLQLEEEYRKN